MKAYRYIGLAACALLPFTVQAQTSIDFESESSYKSIGVYDNWPDSPFRTGELTGNVAVVSNHLNEGVNGADPVNSSSKILGVQRSRFGSNTFGVRVDLNETFELTTELQYVHVLINRPVEGRVMLIGLGKRQERAGQSPETEQFWVLSSNTIPADTWTDAVFPIKGAGGIDIYSLVVVPECESPHERTSDFVAYFDNIIINDDRKPFTLGNVDYPINYDESTAQARSDRYINTIGFSVPSATDQKLAVNQSTAKLLYIPMLDTQLTAKAGEAATVTFTGAQNWMHSYAYLDRGQDGKFSTELNSDGTPTDESDVMGYTYYDGKNSSGTTLSNQNPGWSPLNFTVPSTLSKGFYRVRFKIDWDCIDAGGNVDNGNDIDDNGGIIADARLNVHEDQVSIKRAGGLNGDILCEDGSALANVSHDFNTAFTVLAKPANGFTFEKIRVRHGYNLSGDSLVHSTAQWAEEYYYASEFDSDGKFTIPATSIDGDVEIEPYFVSTTGINTAESANAAPFTWDVESGKLSISTTGEQHITIVDATGRTIFSANVEGNKKVSLQSGAYVLNGQKILVP